jgi:hypothetical protein
MPFEPVQKPFKARRRSAKTDSVILRPSKSGNGVLTISHDVADRAGFANDDRVVILKGTGEDAGWLQVRLAEGDERGRKIKSAKTGMRIPLDAEMYGIAMPPSASNVEFEISSNDLQLDMKSIESGSESEGAPSKPGKKGKGAAQLAAA